MAADTTNDSTAPGSGGREEKTPGAVRAPAPAPVN
jgi:hypothetical protein